MQCKLPSRQQPPAILLPSLLFSGAACSGTDLLGLLLSVRKCCSSSYLGEWWPCSGDAPGEPQLALTSGGANLRSSGGSISNIPSLVGTATVPGMVDPCGISSMFSIHLLLLQVRRNSLCWAHWACSTGNEPPRNDCPQNPAGYFGVVWVIRVLHPPALPVLYKLKISFYNGWAHVKREKGGKKCNSSSYK